MIQFVSGNIEQANELMLFNCAEILLKLELYLKNIFQILSNTSFKYKYKYKYTNLVFSNTNANTNICVFEYKYKYECVFGPSPDLCTPHIIVSSFTCAYLLRPGDEYMRQ